MATLHSLPDELLRLVLQCLPSASLARAHSVGAAWLAVALTLPLPSVTLGANTTKPALAASLETLRHRGLLRLDLSACERLPSVALLVVADLVPGLLEAVGPARGEDEPAAPLGEGQGDVHPQPARGAGDQDHSIAQPPHAIPPRQVRDLTAVGAAPPSDRAWERGLGYPLSVLQDGEAKMIDGGRRGRSGWGVGVGVLAALLAGCTPDEPEPRPAPPASRRP